MGTGGYTLKSISRKNRIFPIIGALAAMILCFIVLYAGDNVGLSDNGDFRRVLLSTNLSYADDTNHYYLFKQNYKMPVSGDTLAEKVKSVCAINTEDEIYSSPHFQIIKLSKVLNLLSNIVTGHDETSYNIAWLAAIYIFMLSLALWGIFTFFQDMGGAMKITALIIGLVVFCDAGYILYFNSFYGEPLQYTALMMLISVGMMIYKRPSIPKVMYFYVSLYFFAGAKLANIPYSIIVSLLAAVIMIMRKDRLFKISVVLSAAVAIGFMINLYVSIPDWMQNDTTYQSVFFGIVKESDTPGADLKKLGVDEKYACLMNTHAYMEENEYPVDIKSEQFQKDFYDKVSKTDILFFYLTHPKRFVEKLSISIENSAYIRPPSVGNSSVELMEITNRWSMWSNLRVALKFLYHPLVIYVVFIILTVYIILVDIFLIYHRRKESPNRLYMLCGINILILGLWINLMLPILGNGEADIAKHMFLFTNCIDILFAVLIIGMFGMKRRNVIITLMCGSLLTGSFYISPPKKTMILGTYNGKPIRWEVVSRYNDDSVLLITQDIIKECDFDPESNLWENSELREWLNNDFLNGFSEEEKAGIMPVTNSIILSYDDRKRSVAGDHAHYWNYTRGLADDLSKTAYHCYLEDKVFIPTLDMLEDIDVKGAYWVLCPYAGNSFMERYMNSDGFVLHTNVVNKKGVRAVIKYSTENGKERL